MLLSGISCHTSVAGWKHNAITLLKHYFVFPAAIAIHFPWSFFSTSLSTLLAYKALKVGVWT